MQGITGLDLIFIIAAIISIVAFILALIESHSASENAKETKRLLNVIIDGLEENGTAKALRDPTGKVIGFKWHDLEPEVVFSRSEVTKPTAGENPRPGDGVRPDTSD